GERTTEAGNRSLAEQHDRAAQDRTLDREHGDGGPDLEQDRPCATTRPGVLDAERGPAHPPPARRTPRRRHAVGAPRIAAEARAAGTRSHASSPTSRTSAPRASTSSP